MRIPRAAASRRRPAAPAVVDLAAAVAPWLGSGGGAPSPGGDGAALPARDPASLAVRDGAALVELAEAHGVLGMLPDSPGTVGPRAAARAAAVACYLRSLADLRLVREALDEAGARWLAVKGPVVATQLYPRPDLRPFSDVDVLVEPRRLGPALSALEARGGQCLVRNWSLMTRLGLAELPVRLPAGTLLDLHWHLVHRAAARRVWRLDTAALLARVVPAAELEGTPILDPVATLLHLAWHSTKSGGARLLWACDVELAAQRVPPEATEDLVELCRTTRTTLAVAVAVDWAASAFPGGAAARLAAQLAVPGSPWRLAARAAKRRQLARPPGRRTGEALPRATRTSTARSLLALGAAPVVRHRGRRRGSIGDAVAGPSSRADYLGAVAAGRL